MKHNKHLHHESTAGAQSLASAASPQQTEIDRRPSQDEVAQKAYLIYLSQGCPQGQDLQHWLEAEAQTISGNSTGPSAS